MQAWQYAIFGKDEAVAIVYWEEFGWQGSVSFILTYWILELLDEVNRCQTIEVGTLIFEYALALSNLCILFFVFVWNILCPSQGFISTKFYHQ